MRRALGNGLALALVLLAVLPARAGGLAPDLARQLQAAPDSTQKTRVIVQYNGLSLTGLALSLLYGAQSLLDLPLLGGSLLELPLKNVDDLAADPAVGWVSPDRLLFRQGDYDVQSAGADQVWAGSGGGSGAGVAVLDTGAAASDEWAGAGGSRLAAWKDLVNGRLTPYDDNGHGTHVAGIVLGSGARSAGVVTGTAPGARLIAVKVLGADGSGRASTVIRGLQWCIQNRSQYGIRVVNLSLSHAPGESYRTDPLCKAVRRAVQAGLVVVCSAGNRGLNSAGEVVYGGIGSPGNDPSVITVGALNTRGTADRSDDTVCSYSSRGPTYEDHLPKPDLVAPGNWIVSVRAPDSRLDLSYPGNRVDPDGNAENGVDYFRLSGTSMAAPQVAGAAALVLSANPALQPNAVKALLTFTAELLPLRDADGAQLSPGLALLTQGAGSLNADGAVRLAANLDGSAADGQWWHRAPMSYTSTIGGRTFTWGARILWGDYVCEGSGLFSYRQPAWSPQYVWGDQYTWGEDVEPQQSSISQEEPTWSSQSAWNDAALWGDQYTWGEDVTPVSGEPSDSGTNTPPP